MRCIICKRHFLPRNSRQLNCGKVCSRKYKVKMVNKMWHLKYKFKPRIYTEKDRARKREYIKLWSRKPEVKARRRLQRMEPKRWMRSLELKRLYYKLHPEKARERYYKRTYINMASSICLICNKASSESPCPKCWSLWGQLKQRYKALKATLNKLEVQHE